MRTHISIVLPISILLVGAGLAASVWSQDQRNSPHSSHEIVEAAGLKWSPLRLKGASIAVVSGDPDKPGGLYVLRIRNLDGTRIPPHWHPEDENITVLTGTFLVGMGDHFDESRLKAMNAGDFASIPREMRHFAIAKGETVYQVHGIGPFKVNWVNPADVTPNDNRN